VAANESRKEIEQLVRPLNATWTLMRVAILGVAWYKREDYARLLGNFADSARLHDTYDGWLKAAERLLDDLRSQGQAFQKSL
jgi:hypothetical protein